MDFTRRHFTYLPTEIKLSIFQLLSQKELRDTVAAVCSEWENLAHDPSLWRKITINFSDFSANILTREFVVNRIPHAFALKFVGFSRENLASIISESTFNVKLRCLSFTRCDVTSNDISRIVAQSPTMKELRFLYCTLENEMIGDIVKWIKLTKFEVSSCHSINVKHWLRRIVNDCHYLEDIEIKSSEFIPCVSCTPGEMIDTTFTKFRRLILKGILISDDDLRVILEKCPVLKELECSNMRLLTDQGLSHIISNCGMLESLRLRFNTNITANNLMRLPFPLKSLRFLDFDESRLVLFGNSARDVALLKRYPNLEIITSNGRRAINRLLVYKRTFGADYIDKKLAKLRPSHILYGQK